MFKLPTSLSEKDIEVELGRLKKRMHPSVEKIFQEKLTHIQPNVCTENWYKQCVDIVVETVKELQLTISPTTQQNSTYDIFCCESCSDIVTQPLTLYCGHTFCKDCVLNCHDAAYLGMPCRKCTKKQNKTQCWKNLRMGKLHKNVCINSVIKLCYSKEMKASKHKIEGNNYLKKELLNEAEKEYLQALKYDDNVFAWENLSDIKICKKEYETALYYAQKSIIASRRSSSKAFYQQGLAHHGLGNYCQSALSFLKFLSMGGLNENATELLTDSIFKLSKPENRIASAVTECNDHTDVTVGYKERFEAVIKDLLLESLQFCLATAEIPVQPALNVTEDMYKALSIELTCALCCRLFYDPTTTPCGHTFCSNCLERSLDYNNNCPICRFSIAELITTRPKPVTVFLKDFLKSFFPKEYAMQEQTVNNDLFGSVDEVSVFVCSFTLPTIELHLHIFEPRYKLLLRRCIDSGTNRFGMCMFDPIKGFSDYGIMLEIKKHLLLRDGRAFVETVGGARFKVIDRSTKDNYHTATVRWITDKTVEEDCKQNLVDLNKKMYEKCHNWFSQLPQSITKQLYLEFGHMPPMTEEELFSVYGPKWIWWVMIFNVRHSEALITQVLKSECVEQRLMFIEEFFEKSEEA